MSMSKEKLDLTSTDYEIDQIKNDDRRFTASKKDAVFFHLLGIISVIIASIWMFALGSCDPSEMIFVLGLPLWFVGAVAIYLVMFVIGMVYLGKWEEFPFTASEEEDKGGSSK